MTKAIYKQKLPQLGHTTGRNSYWLANVALLLDAILTSGQRIESLVTEGLVTENDLLPILNKNSSGDEIANVNFFTTSHM